MRYRNRVFIDQYVLNLKATLFGITPIFMISLGINLLSGRGFVTLIFELIALLLILIAMALILFVALRKRRVIFDSYESFGMTSQYADAFAEYVRNLPAEKSMIENISLAAIYIECKDYVSADSVLSRVNPGKLNSSQILAYWNNVLVLLLRLNRPQEALIIAEQQMALLDRHVKSRTLYSFRAIHNALCDTLSNVYAYNYAFETARKYQSLLIPPKRFTRLDKAYAAMLGSRIVMCRLMNNHDGALKAYDSAIAYLDGIKSFECSWIKEWWKNRYLDDLNRVYPV